MEGEKKKKERETALQWSAWLYWYTPLCTLLFYFSLNMCLNDLSKMKQAWFKSR